MSELRTLFKEREMRWSTTDEFGVDAIPMPDSATWENARMLSSGIPFELFESKDKFVEWIGKLLESNVHSGSYTWLEEHNERLLAENYALRQRLELIEERLINIERTIPEEKVILIRDISQSEAEKEIKNLFSKGKNLYYSDISEQLNIDLELVVEICNSLQDRGEIQVDGDIL